MNETVHLHLSWTRIILLLIITIIITMMRTVWMEMNEWVSERDQIRGAHPTNLCRRRPVSTTVGIIIILHLGIMSSTRWCVSRVVLALARDNYKDVVVVFSYSSAVDLSENGFLSWCCWDDTTCFCSILQPPLHCPLLSHRCYCFMKSHPSPIHPFEQG